MSKSQRFECPHCGAREGCGCQRVTICADQIPDSTIRSLARPVLAMTRALFDDPDTKADFERWQAERAKRAAAG